MSTTPRVTIPEHAVNEDGVIVMGDVLAEHVPGIARARHRFFDALKATLAVDPVSHELLRLTTAELTGCRLCRNQRNAAAFEAGVDETVIGYAREGAYDRFDAHERATLEFGDRFRAHPGDLPAEPAPQIEELGEVAATAMVLSTGRALADGKALVALGLEPENMTVQVPA